MDGAVSSKNEGSGDANSGFGSVRVSGEFGLFYSGSRSGLTREEGNVTAVHRSDWGCISALSKAGVEGSWRWIRYGFGSIILRKVLSWRVE